MEDMTRFIFIYLSWLHQVLVVAHGILLAACLVEACGKQDLINAKNADR